MLLSHLGKYSCEYESLKFAMNAPKCFDLIVNIMFSVVLKPLLIKILRIIRTLYQQHEWLTDAYYETDGELPSSQHSRKFRKRFVLLLWQSGESCEDEYFNFVLNSSKMAVGLTPRSSVGPLLTNILHIRMLSMLVTAFTNVANAYARFTNGTNSTVNDRLRNIRCNLETGF